MRVKKAYYESEEKAIKTLQEIQSKCNLFLCLQFDEKRKLYFFEY